MYVHPPLSINPSARRVLLWVYALYGACFLTLWFSPIIAVLLVYLKRGDWSGIYATHGEFAITTFWRALCGSIISFLLMVIDVGFVLFIVVQIWFIYRAVLGSVRVWSYRAVNPTAWLEYSK